MFFHFFPFSMELNQITEASYDILQTTYQLQTSRSHNSRKQKQIFSKKVEKSIKSESTINSIVFLLFKIRHTPLFPQPCGVPDLAICHVQETISYSRFIVRHYQHIYYHFLFPKKLKRKKQICHVHAQHYKYKPIPPPPPEIRKRKCLHPSGSQTLTGPSVSSATPHSRFLTAATTAASAGGSCAAHVPPST